MEHYSLENIESYLVGEMNDIELAEMKAHIATCERCHGIYIGLKSLGNGLASAFREEEPSANCPEDWEIGALVLEETSPVEFERISSHIKTCTPCMDRAAHYYRALQTGEALIASPHAWKEKAVQSLKNGVLKQESKASIFQRISDFLRGLFPWGSPVPAYALAAVAIALLILTNLPDQGRILTIASSEKVTTRQSEIPSTMGFMGPGETREVKNMEIQYKKENVVFEWEPVDGATGDKFSVRDSLEGKTVHSTPLNDSATVSLNKGLLTKGRLYGWSITGETTEGEYFEYRGEFLLVD